jgi:hypothetical protein
MRNQRTPSPTDHQPAHADPLGSASGEPQSTRVVLGSPKSDRSAISELRDLCEAVLLAPSSDGDPLAALEPRRDRSPAPPRHETTAFLANELVRRIEELPSVHARVTAQLLSRQGSSGQASRTTAEAAAIRELRSAHGLLDNLGCPRSEDDRPLTIIQRLRWLLDILTNQGARAGGAKSALPLGDTTPATGVQLRNPPGQLLP